MRRVGFAFFALLLAAQGAANAQTLEELRRRADAIDHAARALALLDGCMPEPPKTLNEDALEKALGTSLSDQERTEIAKLARHFQLTNKIPPNQTRLCLLLEEDYGQQGRRLTNLIVVDQKELDRRAQKAANERRQAESERRLREIEEARLREAHVAWEREHAARWRERLTASERACVDAIERGGRIADNAVTAERKLSQQGRDTLFLLHLIVTYGTDLQKRSCFGRFGNNRIEVTKLEVGHVGELPPPNFPPPASPPSQKPRR